MDVKNEKSLLGNSADKERNLDFNVFLASLTVGKLKELIKFYNLNCVGPSSDVEPIKGFSKLKKKELAEMLPSKIDKKYIPDLFAEFYPPLINSLFERAMQIVAEENRMEYIFNASTINAGNGFRILIKGDRWVHKTEADLRNLNNIILKCNCHFGQLNGICIHKIALLMLLIEGNIIEFSDIPYPTGNIDFKPYLRKLNFLAAKRLFKIEPAIQLEEDYRIYIFKNIAQIDWGGKFAGKNMKDFGDEKLKDINMDDWLAEKVTNIVLRKIKPKSGEGTPVWIIVDAYGIIDIILSKEKLVKKILKYFAALNDPNLPKNKDELAKYFKDNVKESEFELKAQPPFEAYMESQPYIFVSYTHKDKLEVYEIINELNKRGYRIWYDEGIPLSEEWEEFIFTRLHDSTLFLSFISPNTFYSEITKKEIFTAYNEKKPFVAIYLKKAVFPEEFKEIRKIQGIEKFDMDQEQFYKKLESKLSLYDLKEI
ncbi:MAG: toll/interleukin-1 receptor domain-containing protein [Promethearchaeota archaeon]